MPFQDLKQEILLKIESGSLGGKDIPEYLKLLCEIGNTNEAVKKIVQGWNRTISFNILELGSFWIRIRNSSFSSGMGNVDTAHIVLSLSQELAVSMFKGEIKPGQAFMNGQLQFEGNFSDIHIFQKMIKLIGAEIRN
ncbi:MAG: SCP2 sterol-binding domain-containing protein [Anaerolineaceae bacterium]|nr:SCP2 sterol-binding domain-containing protein [Anaerolineaceae bacterium]